MGKSSALNYSQSQVDDHLAQERKKLNLELKGGITDPTEDFCACAIEELLSEFSRDPTCFQHKTAYPEELEPGFMSLVWSESLKISHTSKNTTVKISYKLSGHKTTIACPVTGTKVSRSCGNTIEVSAGVFVIPYCYKLPGNKKVNLFFAKSPKRKAKKSNFIEKLFFNPRISEHDIVLPSSRNNIPVSVTSSPVAPANVPAMPPCPADFQMMQDFDEDPDCLQDPCNDGLMSCPDYFSPQECLNPELAGQPQPYYEQQSQDSPMIELPSDFCIAPEELGLDMIDIDPAVQQQLLDSLNFQISSTDPQYTCGKQPPPVEPAVDQDRAEKRQKRSQSFDENAGLPQQFMEDLLLEPLTWGIYEG